MADEVEGTPDPTQAAAAPAAAPAAPSPAESPTAGSAPWSSDLAFIEDPALRGQVDNYLREKWQPRTTQLEQELAQSADARQLWQQFQDQETAADAYVRITHELFGDEAADNVLAYMQQGQQEEPAVTDLYQQQEPAPTDPRFESVASWVEEQQAEREYAEEMDRITSSIDARRQTDPTLPEIVPDFFHKHVHAAEGDFDRAYDLYAAEERMRAERAAAAGVTVPDPAPNVVGSDTQGATSTTPTQRRYTAGNEIAEAIDEFMAEDRARRQQAPPVGMA